jgi:hypothetical protein
MSQHLVQRVASFSLALSLILGLLPRLALCVGPDGHQAIEAMNASCCDRATHSTGADVRVSPDGCAAGCIDTPLTVNLAPGRDRTHAATAPPPSGPAAAVPSVRAQQVVAYLHRSTRGAVFQSPPRILRTTVDLC